MTPAPKSPTVTRDIQETIRLVEYDMLNRRTGHGDGFVGERAEVAEVIQALRHRLAASTPGEDVDAATEVLRRHAAAIGVRTITVVADAPPAAVERGEVARDTYGTAIALLRMIPLHRLDVGDRAEISLFLSSLSQVRP